MNQTTSKYQTVLIYIGLLLVTVVAFANVRNCGFVYDDRAYVQENEYVKAGLKSDSIKWAFTSSHVGNWHPLTGITHMLDCQLFGLNPAGHHVTNLLIHTANVLLLFWVLKNMTGAVWPSAFAAALFAIHPLRVESVAWISERKDVLSGLFWILTMAAYARYVKRANLASYLLVIVSFSMALMSKPMVVTLPFVLLLLDYWPLKRFEQFHGASGPVLKDFLKSKLVLEKLPLLVLAAAVSAATFMIQKGAGAFFSLKNLPIGWRIANALVAYAKYIGKMIWPRNLAVLYQHPLDSLPLWQVLVAVFVLAGISAIVIYSYRRRPYLSLGWLWYMGTLVPVIGIVQVGSQAIADRYTYLPSIGINIMVAWGFSQLSGSWRHKKAALATAAAVVIAVLLVCTRLQVRHWTDRIALYGHTVAVTKDNQMMHNNYGTALFDAGRFEEAAEQYRHAIRIEPKYFEARINLGKTYIGQKRFARAAEYFRHLIKLRPDHLEANVLLAKILLIDLGDVAAAVKQYRQILQLKPDRIETLNNLAWMLATTDDEKLSNPADALQLAQKAYELSQSDNPQLLDTLAAAYAAVGKFAEAVETAEQALSLAKSEKNEDLVAQLQNRLALYRNRQPYYESFTAASTIRKEKTNKALMDADNTK